jgi:predicted secreted protein
MMISLVANPSTGTAWHIEALDSAVVVPLCEAFSAFRPDLVGSAGLSHGFYQATQPGETSLELLYYRDWEGPSTATARFTVTVVVD